MKFKAQEVVRGISQFAGNIDGEEIKSGYVHVDVKLDDSKGFGKGTRTEAMRSTLDVVKSIAHNTFPLICELEVEQVASRKGTQLQVVGVRPVSQAKQAA